METLVDTDEELVFHSIFNWKPIEMYEGLMGGCIFNTLEFYN